MSRHHICEVCFRPANDHLELEGDDYFWPARCCPGCRCREDYPAVRAAALAPLVKDEP